MDFVHLQKSLSNLIEIKMEELRKSSLKLAIWNLGVTVLVSINIITFFAGKNPLVNQTDMKAFTAWNCVMYAVLLPFLYYQWFKFFKAMNDAYPDNDILRHTIRLGSIAYIIYSAASAIGLFATVFDSFIVTPDIFGWNTNSSGIFPKNAVGERCNDLITGAGLLMAVMYYFLCRQVEPQSKMRVLTIILALELPLTMIISLAIQSITLMTFVNAIFWITEFLFLMQIYKGYEFGKPKEEVSGFA